MKDKLVLKRQTSFSNNSPTKLDAPPNTINEYALSATMVASVRCSGFLRTDESDQVRVSKIEGEWMEHLKTTQMIHS